MACSREAQLRAVYCDDIERIERQREDVRAR